MNGDLSPEGRIHHLLNVNRRLLNIARECEFNDLVIEIREEIERLKQLRRLAAAALHARDIGSARLGRSPKASIPIAGCHAETIR